MFAQTEPDYFARWIAVLALFVSVIALGWEVVKWRKESQKQREDESERVEANLLESNGVLTLNLYNPCKFDINVTSVSLHYRETSANPNVSKSLKMVTVKLLELPTASADAGSEYVATGSQDTATVPPRKAVKYTLPALEQSILESICQLPNEHVWISVETHAGVITTVTDVLGCLKTTTPRHQM